MKIINIQEAKTHLSRLVEEVLKGEELVIAKAGKPLVKLVPFSPQAGERQLGFLVGQGYWEAPDCWDPDPELEGLFLGELPKWSEDERAAAQAWLDGPSKEITPTEEPQIGKVAEDEPPR